MPITPPDLEDQMPAATVTLPNVVVPYDEFLARRARRLRIVSELGRRDGPDPVGPDAQAMAVARPMSSEQK